MSNQPSTSTLQPPPSTHQKGHHRRTSSLWVPPTRPVLSNPSHLIREKAETGGRALKQLVPFSRCCFGEGPQTVKYRTITPNNQAEPPARYEHPNRQFAANEINTTKYSFLTFLPKNLFEQFHRAANIYFIFIVILNFIIGVFGKYVSFLPISFVLAVTAIKDAFEDFRRYKSDTKINHRTGRVWDSSQGRYRKLEWKHILVGDFVHLSHDEIIPADILLLRSSDPNGVCYVETSNLDGESNLKQRTAIRAMGKYHSVTVPQPFSPDEFKYKVVVEEPSTDVYRFEGRLESVEGGPPLVRELTLLSKESVLLRGCVIKNTDFVEGIVLYAGSETKAMLNNSGPRYKRSSLEKMTNWDIVWCVLILGVLCTLGAVFSSVWLHSYDEPSKVPFTVTDRNTKTFIEGLEEFGSYIICLQVLIPISLYVSIEIIKLGQVWLMSNDRNMYYEPLDKKIQCRALNIPEELGQIEYVMSDKTGTLTENQMIFRRCSVSGRDFGGMSVVSEDGNTTIRPRHSKDRALESLLSQSLRLRDSSHSLVTFFLTMAICNTVVVNAKPHEDMMDEEGDVVETRDDQVERDREREARTAMNVQFASSLEDARGCDTPDSHASLELIELHSQSSQDRSLADEGNTVEEKESALDEESIEKEKSEESVDKVDDAEKTDGGEEKEKKKGLQGILAHSRPSLLNLSRLKGIKDFSPFRRSVSKSLTSASTPSEVLPPPVHSYYDSESPDELALVEAARDYGVRLLKRHFDEVVVYVKATSGQMKFKVLHTLPFDADRKRMSVIVREVEKEKDGKVILLCKGADASILPLLSSDFTASPEGEELVHKAQNDLTDYAREGLRTLCLARKVIPEDEYLAWRCLHEEAELDVHHKENLLKESTMRIENELELLGVTAIEDRLQDGVPECIHSLREAGIKVWVLTGDKVETAVNIAYSSRLFSPSMDLLNVGANSIRTVSELIDLYHEKIDRAVEVTESAAFGLVVNGASLDYCIDPHNQEKFVRLLGKSRSVLCCRATPLQKASLVRLAKQQLHGKVLAIGDGANDVSMIQGADVGVGLSGQEGMQAVMASDYALARFRFLAPLLLVHGHWCYHRLSNTILYFFYKNAMFVFCIFWYQIFNGFSSQVNIDPIYLMVYNLLFTSVPCLLYGCLEQDASYEMLMENPQFYDQGRLGKKYKWYSFWLNMVDAVWQSAVVYFVGHVTYTGMDVGMWKFGTMQCAQLLITNTLHLGLMVQYWTWPLFLALFLSIVAFFAFALIYNAMVVPSWNAVKDTPVLVAEFAIIDPRFWLCILLSGVIAILPRFIFLCLRNSVHPSRLLIRRVSSSSKSSHTLFSILRVNRAKRRQQDVHMSMDSTVSRHTSATQNSDDKRV